MKFGTGWTRALGIGVFGLLAGCGSTTAAGGGVLAPDVVADLSLSFGTKDTAAGKDAAAGADASALEVSVLDDAATDNGGTDAATVDDTSPGDATDFFDPDVADTGAKDTGGQDASTADVSGTCGNGTCGAGETCQNCAVDCPCTPCNPLTSVGCKTAQQCYATDTGLQCGGAGTVADGGVCKYLNDCTLGSMCVGGLCRKVCATVGSSGPACDAAATCEELGTATGAIGYNLGACFAPDNCSLITSSGCPTGFACLPGTSGKQCTQAGTVGLDGVCASASDCAVGFLCLNNGATSGTCKKRCNTTDATTCPAGLTCGTITIGSPPVLVGENFGVCDKP